MERCTIIQNDAYPDHQTSSTIMVYFSNMGKQVAGSIHVKYVKNQWCSEGIYIHNTINPFFSSIL